MKHVNRFFAAIENALMLIAEVVLIRLLDIVLLTMLGIASIFTGYAMVRMIFAESQELLETAYNSMGYAVQDVATTFMIQLLSVADSILLAGFIVLVIRGTFQGYIRELKHSRLTGQPLASVSAFRHLSIGILKEKGLGTLGLASAIFLFRMMLDFGPRQGMAITWVEIGMLAIFHFMFIFGGGILSYFNLKHDQNSHASQEEHA